MAQYVYSMNRVSKTVPPKRQILKDISLSFFPGAKIGVLGLNGSGKSTLLKIMAGVDKEIEGEAIPMPGIKIGYLPQEPQLNPEHTVRESVEEAMGEVFAAKAKLEEVYAAYAEPDADFDALAAEQARLEAIIATAGTDSEHQLEIARVNAELVALNDVSIATDRGEIAALLGPSGSGKSTLLTALGFLNPALYAMGNSTNYDTYFNDITSGLNNC